MKYFTLLILPFFLISCGTETSVDEPETETVRIGSFDVVTNLETGEKHANWVGVQSAKMKFAESDTVWFDSPDGHAITIEDVVGEESAVTFFYRDSSYTTIENFSDFGLSNPITVVDAWTFGYSDDHIEANQVIHYDCDRDYDLSGEEHIEFFFIDNGVRYVHLFNLSGMIESIEVVNGCNN